MQILLEKTISRLSKMRYMKYLSRKIYCCLIPKNRTDYLQDVTEDVVNGISPRPEGHALWTTNVGNMPPRADVRVTNTSYNCDLSIIIPFYNTKEYAKKCIESVRNQRTQYRYEIILVDDGSSDGCSDIIEEYRSDKRVIVIHQENKGVAAARNMGINNASGRYVMFVDSDDILCEGAIERLLSAAYLHDAEIVEGSYQMMRQNGKLMRTKGLHTFSVSNKGKEMFGYPWGKVIIKSLFEKVCFPEGYWYEDTIISALIYPQAKITVTLPDCVILYRINRQGLSALGRKKKKSIDAFYIVEEILDTCVKLGIEASSKAMVRQLGPYLYLRIRHLQEEEVKAVFLLASNLAMKYNLLTLDTENNFYENELNEALRNKQYLRWKWASILM